MDACTEVSKPPAMEFHLDLKYEFCAPHFFDFSIGETEEEAAAAQRWFRGAISDPASPLVGKVRSVQELATSSTLEEYIEVQKLVARVTPEISKEMETEIIRDDLGEEAATRAAEEANMLNQEIGAAFKSTGLCSGVPGDRVKEDPCTPKEQFSQHFAELKSIKSHIGHNLTSKWNRSELQKQAALNNIRQLAPSTKLAAKRCLTGSQKTMLPEETHATKKQKLEVVQSRQVGITKTSQALSTMTVSQQFRLNSEKQVCKRQKLEGGGFCQTKTPWAAPTLTVPYEFHFHTEQRAHIHKEVGQCGSEAQAQCSSTPYVPVAEMVQRFQKNIMGDLGTQNKATLSRKRSLKLTRPKEPMLGTTLRARPPTVKSFAEQEEEMLANLPRFKARPLNKKILQGPTLPPLPRSIPQLPEFQEFNLRTMERALMYQQALPSMHVSSSIEYRERSTKGELHFQMDAGTRLPMMKSTRELDRDLGLLPKFKALPLDKRIFSSKGDVGVFTVSKRQATIPKEFQFATDQRAQYHDAILMEQQNQDCIENHGVDHRAELNGKGWQTTSAQSKICPVYPERSRKPLGEIQECFVFGQASQQTIVHKKHVENNYQPCPLRQLQPQVRQSEAFPFPIRAMKDRYQHSAATQQIGRPARGGHLEKAPLPMYFMR